MFLQSGKTKSQKNPQIASRIDIKHFGRRLKPEQRVRHDIRGSSSLGPPFQINKSAMSVHATFDPR